VTEDRFVILTVAYEPYAGRGPSLESIAPEPKNAGLSLIEDNHRGWNPSCKWAGLVDAPTFERNQMSSSGDRRATVADQRIGLDASRSPRRPMSGLEYPRHLRPSVFTRLLGQSCPGS
jgi:hypothetical protein